MSIHGYKLYQISTNVLYSPELEVAEKRKVSVRLGSSIKDDL